MEAAALWLLIEHRGSPVFSLKRGRAAETDFSG